MVTAQPNETDFLDDVRNWILDSSHLSLDSLQVRTYIEPDRFKDPTITLYTGSTEKGDQTQDRPRPAIEYLHAQLIVRDKKMAVAQRLAQRLYEFMYDNAAPWPYETIWPVHPPVRLGPPDGTARWPVGFAIRAQRTA